MAAAGVLLAVLATWFITFALSAARPSHQLLSEHSAGLAVQEDILTLSVKGDTERYLQFYISGDALACALLERGAGGFVVNDVAGGLALTSSEAQGIWMPFGLNNDDEYFIVGLVYDDAVRKVQVEGMPTVLVDNGVYRCWYYQGEGTMSINSQSVVYVV